MSLSFSLYLPLFPFVCLFLSISVSLAFTTVNEIVLWNPRSSSREQQTNIGFWADGKKAPYQILRLFSSKEMYNFICMRVRLRITKYNQYAFVLSRSLNLFRCVHWGTTRIFALTTAVHSCLITLSGQQYIIKMYTIQWLLDVW